MSYSQVVGGEQLSMMTRDELRMWRDRELEMSNEKGLSSEFILDCLKTVMILDAVLQED